LDLAFKILFNSGLTKNHALERLQKEIAKPCAEALHLIDFVKNSERGISPSCRKHAASIKSEDNKE
jgi:acyl-[acyl carrier protein]--UDP-N-acetylglucosamine O-acyltransferase